MSLRFDPNNPKDRALLEKSDKGRQGIREYFQSRSTIQKSINKLNQEVQTHNPNRIENLNTTRMTESSKKGQSKYHNHICFDELYGTDQKFDSKWERTCFYRLMDLQNKKVIYNLRTQVKKELNVNGKHICNIIIDFSFATFNPAKLYYVDAKSVATSPTGFKIKMKLFEALWQELHIAESGKSSIIDLLEGKNEIINYKNR